jgi:hypothetical protein
MDPWIRIRMRIRSTNISWIRNTGKEGLPVIGPAPLPRPPPGRPNFHRLLAGAAGCLICPEHHQSLTIASAKTVPGCTALYRYRHR